MVVSRIWKLHMAGMRERTRDGKPGKVQINSRGPQNVLCVPQPYNLKDHFMTAITSFLTPCPTIWQTVRDPYTLSFREGAVTVARLNLIERSFPLTPFPTARPPQAVFRYFILLVIAGLTANLPVFLFSFLSLHCAPLSSVHLSTVIRHMA